MTIKFTEGLTRLAKFCNISSVGLSQRIISIGVKEELIVAPDDWGYTLGAIFQSEPELLFAFAVRCLPRGNNRDVLDVFKDLRVMGPGGCEYCGGELEVWDREPIKVYDKEIIDTIYKCTNCKRKSSDYGTDH